MATVQEILDDIRAHEFSDLSDAAIIDLINDTYLDINSREPWPWKMAFGASNNGGFLVTNNAVDECFIELDSRYRHIMSVYDSVNKRKLIPERIEVLREWYINGEEANTSGARYYSFVPFKDGQNSAIWLYPAQTNISDTDNDYKIDGIRHPSSLTSVSSEVVFDPSHIRVITLGTLAKCYAIMDDVNLARYFEDQYEKRYANLRMTVLATNYDTPGRVFDVRGD